MDCNIIKDLIPLYIDGCCSDESVSEVNRHLENCKECKAVLESMSSSVIKETSVSKPEKFSRLNDWKASVLQSVLFLISFLLITAGVAVEASIPLGFGNSMAAFNVVVPVTAFMLSLTNWYFVKLYKSRKSFSRCCCFLTAFISICAFAWTADHYGINYIEFLKDITFIDMAEHIVFFYSIGITLTIILLVASKILSDVYAKMLGKE